MGVLAAFRRRRFLTATEREQIETGLATARRHAGAPIGLVIDEASGGDPAIRAERLFREWDLAEAERPAAALVYACAATRQFAFEEGRYCDGLFKAIAQVAVQLQHHFPRDSPPLAGGPLDSD